jgi:uncharacterized hydrophobic protein (TIGR00341 family)
MRVLDIYLPKDQAAKVEQLADEKGYHSARTDGEKLSHLRVAAPEGSPDDLLEALDKDYGFSGDDPQGFFVVSEPLTITPRDEEAIEKRARRAAFEEIEQFAEDGGQLDRTFWVLSACAAVLAAGGIILGSTAVIVGAMVIAPVFKPLTAISVGIATARPKVALRGLLAGAIANGLAVLAGLLFALLTPLIATNATIEGRSELSLFNTIVAIAAGIAAGYTVIRNDRSTLVGIVIAASLVPAAAAMGVGLGAGFWLLAANSALTLATNIVAVVVAIVAVFRIEQVRSPVWREAIKGKDASKRTIWLGLITLALLAAPIVVVFGVKYKDESLERGVSRAVDAARNDAVVLGHRFVDGGARVRIFVAETPDPETRRKVEERLSDLNGGVGVEWVVPGHPGSHAGGQSGGEPEQKLSEN